MLLDLDPRVEGLRRVAGQHRDDGLGNDRPAVHSGINEMDGTATFGGSILYRLRPSLQAWIVWEEGRVDINDPARESIQQWGSQEAHEPGEADEVDSCIAKGPGSFLLRLPGKLGAEPTAVDQA